MFQRVKATFKCKYAFSLVSWRSARQAIILTFVAFLR